MIGKNVDWNHEQLRAGWILIKDNFNVTIWMEKKTACIWWLKETSFGFENQEVQFFWYTCNRFRLLDTDSGILIQIRFYFVLHLIQIQASWYRFGHSWDPYADRESSNLIQGHAIWYRFVFILCISDTESWNLIKGHTVWYRFVVILWIIQNYTELYSEWRGT